MMHNISSNFLDLSEVLSSEVAAYYKRNYKIIKLPSINCGAPLHISISGNYVYFISCDNRLNCFRQPWDICFSLLYYEIISEKGKSYGVFNSSGYVGELNVDELKKLIIKTTLHFVTTCR